MKEDLMSLLFDINPYNDLDYKELKIDLQGWNSDRKIFHRLIDKTKPKLVIEVGTWKGASAINMARYIKKNKLGCKILCIDTWLGSLEMLQAKNSKYPKEWYNALMHKNGFPMLYYQFLYNVIAKKMTDTIIPFPNTSAIASRWLKWKDIKADLIYIDGSHHFDDAYYDIKSYYDILNDNGIIFGDDYKGWPGVRKAVQRFCRLKKIKYKLVEGGDVWIINKK